MPVQTRGLGICSVEGCNKTDDAPKGLCYEHYRRFRNYGTFEKLRRPKGKATCSVEGCENPDDGGRGLCRLHYMRQRHHGHTGLVNKGAKRSHPLYHLWYDRKSSGCLSEEWLGFERFVADVSPEPDEPSFLVRLDGKRPYGPGNFQWQPHLKRRPGEPKKEWWARKWAARQAANPSMERGRSLMRRFQITVADYEAMLARQNGLCAICRKPETAVDGKTGSLKRLAVDHNHKTGKIRALLCWRCNATIGKLDEDLDLLDAMRAYLVKHLEQARG